MKIRSKLFLNASIVILAVGAVSVTSFISMQSIKGKLSYLTEKSTPFQMRTVEFQRALQGATADLIKVIAARNEPEFAAAKGEAEKSLEEVKKSQESLEGLSGEKLEASGELNGIASELFSTMTAKLKSERESAEANAHITQMAQEANARIRDLDGKVKTLQQTSSAAYATANEEADKTSKKLGSIETLKVSLKDIQYLLVDLPRAQNKKTAHERFAVAMKKIMQNSNVRQNKKIGAEFGAFSAKMEELAKVQAIGGDSHRAETLFKEANDAFTKIGDIIEDEVDESQQISAIIYPKLPRYLTKANIAVNVLSSNTNLVSLGKSLEGLAARLFFVSTEKELDAIAAEMNQHYLKIASVGNSVESLLRSAGAQRELEVLRQATRSLGSIRETIFMREGILAKLHQKMQLQIKAEKGAARLRDIVASQAEKGKLTVSVAQGGQEKAIGAVNRTIRLSMSLILAIAVGSAVLGSLIGMWIYRSITRPIEQLIATAEQVAEGNLCVSLASSSKDEVGQVQTSMAKMVGSIRDIVGRIGLATDTLASSSVELATTAEGLESGAARQEKRAGDSAAAMTEMSATTMDMARSSAETAEAADRMKETAEEGKQAMQSTMRELQRFAETFTGTAGKVEQLGDQSSQINDIVTLIRDIADQTNLLALNAAIEAARAGDQGRGFAVVADSVRGLAERTSHATADIANTVKVMQVSVTQAVGQMHQERQTVSTILREVSTTLEAIDRIVQYVDRVTDMVRRIAVATEEQSATSSEVSHHVEEIALLTHELSGSCRGIRESSNDLSRLATDLHGMVGWFRV